MGADIRQQRESRRRAATAHTNGHEADSEVLDLTDDSLHIESADPPPLDDSDVDLDHQQRYGTLENLIDGFAEAFNAHDLDGMVGVMSDDVELPGLGTDAAGFREAMDSVWERRPNAILTRGLLVEEPVTVVWDVDEHGGWQRLALFGYDLVDDCIGLVELIDDGGLAAEVETMEPEPELAEGATWDEWYEGADSADT